MPFKPVDQNIKVILGPCIDDTDFKTREELLTYNQAGMEIDVILEKHDGTIVTTAVTPTTGGVHDWAHTDQGYYELEIPATGGNYANAEEGILRAVGYCTGVLPFSSVAYDIAPTQVYDSLIKGTDDLDVQVTGEDNIDFGALKKTSLNAATPASTGTVTGNVDGSVASVSGAVGSVTGAVGNVTGAVGSVTGAVGSVTADVGVTQTGADKVWDTTVRALSTPNDYKADVSGLAPSATALSNAVWTDAKAVFLDHSVATVDTVVDGIQTDLSNATDGLGALKALIDTVDGVVDTILIDTNELQTDWVNAGRLDAILDSILAILDNARGEPGQGAPPVNPDAVTKLDYLYKSWRNKKTNDGTTRKIYNDAGAVVDQKSGLSEVAGTVTVDEMVSGP